MYAPRTIGESMLHLNAKSCRQFNCGNLQEQRRKGQSLFVYMEELFGGLNKSQQYTCVDDIKIREDVLRIYLK